MIVTNLRVSGDFRVPVRVWGDFLRLSMKRLLIPIAFALTFSGLAMAKTWGTATSTNDATGRALVFRFVGDLDPGFDRASQPVRVIITWKYEGTNGMPVPAERQRMDAMEDLLAPALEADGFSTLALVSTGEDLREWIYYAKSEESFFARLNEALGGHPAFPIEIHVAADPKWENYQEFMDGLKK